jgi:adenosine kinase
MAFLRIAVSGSIALDHLMVFPGRFTEQLVDGKLDKLSLSFLVDELRVHPGGVAANIGYGLGCLGARPALIGTVGADYAPYRARLEEHGVDFGAVRVSATKHTARFLCTTDNHENQIASFYAGAMAEARELDLADVLGSDAADLVLVSPNDPEAMVRHTEQCRALGQAFAADPSQQLARLDGGQVRSLITGARYLFTNEYEAELLLRATGWSRAEVLAQVGMWVVTQGADGASVDRAGERTLHVAAVPPKEIVDPTGVGDAFRAGFLWGQCAQLDLERSVQAGATLATIALETPGSQEYLFDRADFVQRVARAYGEPAAADLERELRP